MGTVMGSAEDTATGIPGGGDMDEEVDEVGAGVSVLISRRSGIRGCIKKKKEKKSSVLYVAVLIFSMDSSRHCCLVLCFWLSAFSSRSLACPTFLFGIICMPTFAHPLSEILADSSLPLDPPFS